MFRLIKLAVYAAIGYKLFQYFTGLDFSPQHSTSRRRQSHPQNMTGPAQGRRTRIDNGEETGGHTALTGRGVIRQ